MPPPLPPGNGGGGKQGSLVWLWVLLGGLGVALLVGVLVAVGVFMAKIEGMSGDLAWGPVEVSEVGLMEDRVGHVTEWYEPAEMVDKFEASGEADEPPDREFELVKYPSPVGELVAYLTADPGDGEKRPAMVWAKGGFGGIGSYFWEEVGVEDDQSARAFRESGMVMMCPSWRGENDNPGRFELFYGEVEDLLAAVEYVKALPYVDAERVYIGGHSTGGTMVLLAAAAGADVRAAFSFGGVVNLGDDLDLRDTYDNAPYDRRSDQRGNSLRSAVRYTPFIEAPVFYFEGEEHFEEEVKQMDVTAAEHGVAFESFELPGDHWNILDPVTRLVAAKIGEDSGEECGISFTEVELASAWHAAHNKPVDETLERWMATGGELDVMLDALGEDVGADDREDVVAMSRAVRVLMEREGDEALADLARVVALIRPTMDEGALEYFDARLARVVRKWVRENTSDAVSEAEADAVFSVVVTLIYNFDEEAGAIVLELIERGFAVDHASWEDVLESLDPEDGMFEEVVAGLRKELPGGAMGVILMHWASHRMLDENWAGAHLFDSGAGAELLRGYLESGTSYDAYRAAFALGFVSDEVREGLVDLGLANPDAEVRLEVAWSDVKTGGEVGVKVLAEACLDLEFSRIAVEYLEGFEKADTVPAAAREPDFVAKAEMVEWLKHPKELGEMPESIEVFDTREIYWPPAEEKVVVWLMKFSYRFDENEPLKTGYGMVGGMTWSSFEEYETEPSVEALYVHHCELELRHVRGEEVTEEEVREMLEF